MSAVAASMFSLPDDGWFHIATPGEWPHKPTGLLQVLDDDAMQSIVSYFKECSHQDNWPGVLIDFDHQSLDQDKPSVAAGWIIDLDQRPNGIWARIRWSDLGQKSIEGGRYRFISPVWRSTDCAMLGEDRIRPLKLMNCAVTNDPNIKGLFPLSNADTTVPLRFAPPALPIPPRAIPLRMQGGLLLRNAVRGPNDMSDAQRRFLHARLNQRERGSSPRYSRDHAGRINELEDRRAALELYVSDPEPQPKSYDLIDVRQAERDAMRSGANGGDILAAGRAANEHNARVTAELNDIKRRIKRQYPGNRAAQERAFHRHMAEEQKSFQKEHAAWSRKQTLRENELAKIDQQIKAENLRWDESENRADIDDAKKAEKAKAQAIKDQIAADKAAERARQAEARKQAAIASDPIKAHKALVSKRNQYITALAAGDYDHARKIYPEADHEAMIARVQAVTSASGHFDQKNMRRNLANLKLQPLLLAAP
jgi:hypothetical protein